MKVLFDTKQKMINDCGSGLVVLLYNEEAVSQTDRVQTGVDSDGNAVYEDKAVTRYRYDKLELHLPVPEVADAGVLAAVKEHEDELVNAYDKSESVNCFFLIKDTQRLLYWLDRDTRNDLSHSVTIWKAAGNESYTLDLREYGTSVEVSCDTLLTMLDSLEAYAVKCFNATSVHLNAIKALTDIEAVLDYDYTTGYPDKLEFTL